MVTVAIGLLLASALDFAGTGLANVPHLRDQRNQLNYAQGTVDGAINKIRNSTVFGTTATDCPTFTPPVLASGLDSGADGTKQFRATCTALASGHEPGAFAPVWAIQTLGANQAPNTTDCSNPCPAGINQSSGTNNTLTIDGGIYSAGRVWNKGSGGVDMVVEGSVYAAGACSGTIHTTDPSGLHCGQAQSFGADPAYGAAVGSTSSSIDLATLISTYGADPLPTCPSTNSNIAWFSQGYYSEQPSTLLKEASNASGSNCGGNEAVYWFQPGFYYFDFTNATAGNDWNVNKVVGGTAVGSWTTNGNSLPTDGTACDSSTDPDTSQPLSPGVQFIFGGDSTFNVGHGDILDICGPDQAQSPGSTQSIAVYGLNGNSNQHTTTPVAQTNQVETADADPTASPVSGFQNPANAKTIDTVNQSTAVMGNNGSDSLAYSSFQNIPDGASDVSATIRLARTIVGSVNKETLAIKFPGSATATTISVPNSCANLTTSCDIPVPDGAWPSNYTRWRQFDGASLTYTVTTGSHDTATVNVDGIALLASYTEPALEALSIGSNYFTDSSDPQVTIYMHGTYYTPGNGLLVEGQNYGRVIFSRGVIASSVLIDSNPSFTQTDAPFQTPGSTSERLVKFVGSVSTDGGSTWTDLVQACVQYNDNNSSGSSGPALPGYTLTIKGWTVLRSSSQAAPTCA